MLTLKKVVKAPPMPEEAGARPSDDDVLDACSDILGIFLNQAKPGESAPEKSASAESVELVKVVTTQPMPEDAAVRPWENQADEKRSRCFNCCLCLQVTACLAEICCVVCCKKKKQDVSDN